MNKALKGLLYGNHYTYNPDNSQHLDSATVVVEKGFVIPLTQKTVFTCANCDNTCDKPIIVHWKLNKSKTQWCGRCTCRKTFKS